MEKYQKWAYIGICFALFAALAFFILKYALGIILPFAFSFITVSLARPLINRICSKKNISKPFVSVAVIGVVLILFISLTVLCVSAGIEQLSDISNAIFGNLQKDDNYLTRVLRFFENIKEKIPFLKATPYGDENEIYGMIAGMISNALNTLGGKLTSFLTSFIRFLPEVFITIIIILVSLFYFSKDYDTLGAGFLNMLPERVSEKIPSVKKDVISVISKYIKSYLFLFFLTFVELYVGFLIIGVKNSFVLAFLVAIWDLLPVFGVGSILMPWAVIMIIGGNVPTGICLMVLYLVIYILRQIEEPKIISKEMNVHPLITLFAMFAGLKTVGFAGMIFAPLFAFIIKTVYESSKKEKNIENKKQI